MTYDVPYKKHNIWIANVQLVYVVVSCPDPPSGGCGEREKEASPSRDTHQKEGLGTRLSMWGSLRLAPINNYYSDFGTVYIELYQ